MKVQAEKIISKLFSKRVGKEADSIEPIAPSGSPRKYYRLSSDGKTFIVAYNPDIRENKAFTYLTRHFHSMGLPVPELLAEDDTSMGYLLSDLGDDILFDHITSRENPEEVPASLFSMLSSAVKLLPHFQVEGAQGLDWSLCYPREAFDKQSMMWDLNYFKYYILKTSGITFDEQLLEDDFQQFSKFLMQSEMKYFMLRDFQSRNVMIKDGKPWLIDYQGGRHGPLQYDLASFLYQVKAQLPEGIRNKLIAEYLDELNEIHSVDTDMFMKHFYPFVYLRLFQVLGAYGFRGLFEKRPHFAESLEPALASLAQLIELHPLEQELPELKEALKKLTQNSNYLPFEHQKSGLKVSISSFSYKRGLPADEGGHGGGFIFDCRALPNPGRQEEYRPFTGRDKVVIDYLKRYREVDSFLHNVYEICDRAVENYIERGFDHLSISFGCTGGQHRSVYCADRLAEHLSRKYVIYLKLHHREQKITETRTVE